MIETAGDRVVGQFEICRGPMSFSRVFAGKSLHYVMFFPLLIC
jgi:hypothetical protein